MICVKRPDFSCLPDPLRSLFDDGTSAGIFGTPQWYDLVARLGLRDEEQLRVYGDDAAQCALVTVLDRKAGKLLSCLTPYTCEHAPVVRKTDPENFDHVRLLVHQLSRETREFRSVRFSGLDPANALFGAMIAGLRDSGFVVHPFFAWGTWYEDVRGCDFETFLARRPSQLRNTWRRKSGRFEHGGENECRLYQPGDPVEPFIADYLDVYAQSWKQPEPFPKFIPALIAAAAAMGALRMGILRIEGAPAAAQFWLVWRGRATIFKLAHVEKWAKLSPGTILTMRIAEHVLVHDKPAEIDFGRGDDDYKRLWLSQRRELWGIEAEDPRSPLGALRGARLFAAGLFDRWKGRAIPSGDSTQ